MMTDCVVVGAGPAGLATSAALTQRGVDHVILERSQAGDTWRTQRWDSFRLNTPGWMNQLLGEQERYAYADRAEVVQTESRCFFVVNEQKVQFSNRAIAMDLLEAID